VYMISERIASFVEMNFILLYSYFIINQ